MRAAAPVCLLSMGFFVLDSFTLMFAHIHFHNELLGMLFIRLREIHTAVGNADWPLEFVLM